MYYKKNHTSALPPALSECLVHNTKFYAQEVYYVETGD